MFLSNLRSLSGGPLHITALIHIFFHALCQWWHRACFKTTPLSCRALLFWITHIFFLLYEVSWWIYWHAYLFCLFTAFCLLAERFAFLRSREASRTAVKSVWPISYVVSRVTVFLTAQYFKARFVWKCLHSTCTAVGLAVVAFIHMSILLVHLPDVQHAVCPHLLPPNLLK